MPNVSLVEETDKLFDREWLKTIDSEFFQEKAQHCHASNDNAVLRIFGFFVRGVRTITMLVQDHHYMLEVLAVVGELETPIKRLAERLLRYTQRIILRTFSREYSETYISMGLAIKTVNYARPIVPGAQPDPDRFTVNLRQLYRSEEGFMEMAMSLFQHAESVRTSLREGGMLSLLVLESGRQIITLVSRGEERWIVSRPFYTDNLSEQLTDIHFARVMRNLNASLTKGWMMVYTSHLNGKGNRATWLLSNGFVPESYMYEKTIEEL